MSDLVRRKQAGEAWETVEDDGSGSLPSQWVEGDGGTLTLQLDGANTPADYTTVFKIVDSNGETLLEFYSAGEYDIHVRDDNTGGIQVFDHGHTGVVFAAGGVNIVANPAQAIGFYGQSPVARQTGVAVTAAAIHASLVNLGLITA